MVAISVQYSTQKSKFCNNNYSCSVFNRSFQWILKKSLKIPKEKSGAVNRRRTDNTSETKYIRLTNPVPYLEEEEEKKKNTMAKGQKDKQDLQNIVHKIKD